MSENGAETRHHDYALTDDDTELPFDAETEMDGADETALPDLKDESSTLDDAPQTVFPTEDIGRTGGATGLDLVSSRSAGDAPTESLDDNPVVRQLLQQAAERYGRERLGLPDRGDAAPTQVGKKAPSAPTRTVTEPAFPNVSRDRKTGGAPTSRSAAGHPDGGLLRGLAKRLVEQGALQERRAVSIALKARDAGISFMRMLARDRMAGDLHAIYRLVAETCGSELIADKSSLFPRIAGTPWLKPSIAERFEIVPLKSDDPDVFVYATVDPFDVAVRDWVQRRAGTLRVEPLPTLPEVLLDGMERYRSMEADSGDRGSLFVPIDISWSVEEQGTPQLDQWDIPVVVDFILHRAFEMSASDVHIEPTGDSLVVRNRVDGVLHEELRLPSDMQAPVIARVKVLSNLDVAERRLPQDGRISVSIRDHPIDIRVSTLPTVSGEKIVMRLLDESALRPRPESLGLNEHDLRLLLDKISAPYGMILLSGPTGSGKTTTLYSCLSSIDRVARNVVTIEDPVEYRMNGVHQTQVNDSIGMTFANGLRTVLRQDPDVIMVGECRDRETAQLAVQASLTGHLVFSTIHANDAAGVVSRLMDMNVEPFLIANALSVVIAQRLVRLHCEHCAINVDGQEILSGLRAEGISAQKLSRLGIRVEPDLPYAATVGCAHCRHTGYSGRQAVFELFAMTDELRSEVMSDNFEIGRFRSAAREAGMFSMLENAIYLVEEGRTSFSEVIRVLGES